ncbi:cardiolipin synthase [Fusobacterium sp. SYSU M8D902]|uniref:cardiolipin synthase n=1 Tax=Fusobacterium sp. SYSU M8D902 TaxID=3159562 RepID=UPI0032E42A05
MEILIPFFRDYIIVINALFLFIIVLLERKNPLFTLFWITLLVLAPYLGFVAYLFFGLSFRKKRVVNQFYKWKFLYSKKVMGFSHYKELVKWEQLISYVEISSKNQLTSLNTSKIFIDGNDFFSSVKEDLKNAKVSINMEYYIFRGDGLGSEIGEILLKKAQEGVKIKIIVDGAGGYDRKMLKRFKANGIEVGVFFPSIFPWFKITSLRANYRDHRKLCLIDSKYGYISGFNIGDEYLGKGKLGYWRDTGLRIFGEACIELEKEFFFSWGIVKKEKYTYKKEYEYNAEVLKELIEVKGKHSGHMQVVSSGPNYQFRAIRDNALKMIMKAQKYIYIQTPYFVPDDTVLDALKIAALSGVEIKIMIPDKPDHFFIYWVNQYFSGELLDLGVEVYKYGRGFLHSKFIVVDDEVVTVGTANFDYRSFYQNFEINVNIYEKDVARTFREIFNNDIKFSHRLFRSEYSKRGYYIKLKESICRLLAPIM